MTTNRTWAQFMARMPRRRYWHPDAFNWMGDLAWAAHTRVFRGQTSQRRDYANARATAHRAVDAWAIARGMRVRL